MSSISPVLNKEFLPQLNIIRGIASLAVCFYHLSVGGHLFTYGFIKDIGQQGHLGVYMFFVLSGFVICYSLPQSYRYSDSFTFLSKRIVRIEPLFVVSIVLVLLLNFVSAYLLSKPENFDFNFINVLLHFFYINNFTSHAGYYYINPVYWTLGIEFQFYIFIALFFPFLIRRNLTAIVILCLMCVFCFVLPMYTSFIVYIPFFTIGILMFIKLKNQISVVQFFCFFVFNCLIIQVVFGLPQLSVTILTAAIIMLVRHSNPVIDFFSAISYSLYLVHVPVGSKIVNFFKPVAITYYEKTFLLIVAMTVSIAVAYFFYFFVESYFLSLSRKIKYRNNNLPS